MSLVFLGTTATHVNGVLNGPLPFLHQQFYKAHFMEDRGKTRSQYHEKKKKGLRSF
jgi:hypothetical protein